MKWMKTKSLRAAALLLAGVLCAGSVLSVSAEETSMAAETSLEETLESGGEIEETQQEETEESSLEEAPAESGEVQDTKAYLTQEDTGAETPAVEEKTPVVEYKTHVQTFGWQGWKKDGEESGTDGLAKRLEAIQIKVSNTDLSGDIRYKTHVQSYGWQDWSKNGAQSGTSGLAKRLEAIQIELTGELAEAYDVYYRVHAQTFGWMDWAKNGETAGTSGLAKRLEAIQIVLVKKNAEAPGKTNISYAQIPTLQYATHMQTYGWGDWSAEGKTSGITDQDKRMESLKVQIVGGANVSGGIEYRTHVQSYGWLPWTKDGAASGTEGEAKRIEALQVRLTGYLAGVCDVYYRVYVEGYGWLGWAKNGEIAGTSGLALKARAIEIRLGAKSGNPPVYTGGAHKEFTGPGYYNIGGKSYYYSASGSRRTGTGWIRENGKRYYIVNGEKVTGWKYIGGLKYYFNSDGSLCQNVDNIIGVQSSYVIKVNKQANCVTIYANDGANGYVIPVKSMLCSTGDDTPLGTFYTPVKYRWKAMFNGTYAQYATRLTAGQGFLFHSITYSVNGNNHSLLTEGYNGLGVTRSAGCIRLLCSEAYWIYTRCALHTKVIVYNDSNPGPFDRPVLTPIPANQNYDPTDPNL